MRCTRREALRLAGALGGGLAVGAPSRAQAGYPQRPIRLIAPEPPGGLPSTFARMHAEGLARRLGQPVIVDNRAGAGGSIGTKLFLQEPADGHTLLWTYTSNHVITALVRKPMPYHPLNDFEPIGLAVVNTGGFLVVTASLPITSPRALIAHAKAHPGALVFASAGIGSITHLGIELIKARTNVDILHVPYKGPVEALAAVASGEAQLTIPSSLAAVLPLVQAGRVRLLARLGEKRSPDFPDVPTLAEDTVPGMVLPFWMGLAARAGTPPAIVARLNREMNANSAEDPAIRKQAAMSYLEVVEKPPAALRAVIERDFATFSKIVQDNNITATS